MNLSHTADLIIVSVFAAIALRGLLIGLFEIGDAVSKRRARKRRMVDHDRFVAARRAAREETEAKLRLEGRWDNYEIQRAMDAAGKAAAPGYRP